MEKWVLYYLFKLVVEGVLFVFYGEESAVILVGYTVGNESKPQLYIIRKLFWCHVATMATMKFYTFHGLWFILSYKQWFLLNKLQ